MASNSIISCASSSSSSQPHLLLPKYDVFVSFRGEDLRNNFIAFLRRALSENGIDVFKDDEHLKKGKSLEPELLQAIQGSRLFVVVFSKNYASSTWCLRELAEIIKTPSTRQVVLPIFYDVDPSDVRKQNGNYGKAFAEHEKREKMEEVDRWRQALTQVANISGWHIANKSPQDLVIDGIVEKIQKELGPKYSSLPKDNLVGMDSRVEELEKLLHSDSDSGRSDNHVRVVGISGFGGIGKTALARALCERISHQYDSVCFIENVQHISKTFGASGVQKQLLSQCLDETNLEILNVSHGTYLVWTRLRNKRALIILDDVDNNEQLNVFSGNRETLLQECLGGGSRIIIISRDQKILRTYGVHDLYLVQPLKKEEAIQLFCRNAFKTSYILSGYQNLTQKALSYAQGHPLAIKVLGSSLFGETVTQWESILARLNDDPSRDIMNVLRIGFDDLCYTDKQIFLDLACFFPYGFGESEERVSEILDFRGFHPEVGLGVLVNKSLITINNNGEVSMPQVLRDLGQFIVKEESPREPRKWSRLWNYQDLYQVLSDNMDETNIKAIVIDYIPKKFRETTMRVMTIDALSKLRDLELLMLPWDDCEFLGNIDYLSNKLGYIRWKNYPCHCLPQSFQPHKLVELILLKSNIKQLWEETKCLPNLKRLNLSFSEKLVKLQSFGEAINLQTLYLCGCINLKQIDPTSGFPRNLTTLNLVDCKSLIQLPHFRDALNLETLDLEGCKKLRKIDPSISLLKKLYFLNLKGCESLVSLPKDLLELNSLQYLSLFGCSQLYKKCKLQEPRDAEHSNKLCIREGPSHSQSSSSMLNKFITWRLPLNSRKQKDSVNWLLPSISIFSCMRELDLSFCNLFKVPDAIGNLHSLERLRLRGNNFADLPNLKQLSKLIHLNLQHCKRLKNLPELPSPTDLPSSHDRWPTWKEYDESGMGLNVFNCPELGKRKSWRNKCFKWMIEMVKLYIQRNDDYGDRYQRITSIMGGSEIPSWFNSQHVCTDNAIRIDTSSLCNNWIGVAFSVIFVVRHERRTDHPNFSGYRIPLFFHADLVTDESDHIWIFYLSRLSIRFRSIWMRIVGGKGYGVEVKKYGYRMVYKLEDLQSSNFTMMHTETLFPQKLQLTESEENE